MEEILKSSAFEIDAKAWLAAIVESSDDGIISKDLQGIITSWNKGAERLFGYTAEEAIGNPITMLAPPGREQEMTEILERIRQGERVGHFETLRRHKDGHLLEISLTVSPIRNAMGQIVGASKIARDVSRQKGLEREREAIIDEKETLIREVHHRVKNNLQIIASLLRLQARHAGEGELAEALRESLNRVTAMSAVHEVLYSSESLARINCAEVLHILAANLQAVYRPQEGNITLAVEALPMFARMDEAVPLALLASELISNALKHAFPDGRPGRIVVKLGRDGSAFRLVIQDDGVGIQPERYAPSVRTLGFLLVQQLSRQLGAQLRIERRDGTCVELDLPESLFTISESPAPATASSA